MDDTKKSQNQGFSTDDTGDLGDASFNEVVTSELDEYTDSRKGSGQQGFASMPKDKQREIASKGGRAAHAQGTAHEWNSEEARAAGRKGGLSRGNKQQNQDVLEEDLLGAA